MGRSVKFSLAGGFTKEEANRIYEEALDILEQIGIECHHEKIMERLSGIKGLMVEKGRVRVKKEFADGLVKDFKKKQLEKNRKKTEAAASAATGDPKPAKFSLGAPYSCFYWLDYNTDKPRKANTQDLRNALKLLDSLDARGNTAPIVPSDVPPELQRVAMFKASAENSRNIGNHAKGVTSVEEAEIICEMGEASGRPAPYFHLQFFISPLKYDDALLDIGWKFLEKGKKDMAAVWGGPMPCAGATAPLFMPAVFVQGIAESIASEILTSQVFGGEFTPAVTTGLFDMKYGSYLFNSSEFLLLKVASSNLSRELFGYGSSGAVTTNSSAVDAQSAAERAMRVLMSALNGDTGFGSTGMISQDMIFSPEQVIIDREIVDWVQRVTEGLELDEKKGRTLEVLKEVGPGGNFLAHDSTVENVRKFFWQPNLFDRMPVGQWFEQGTMLRDRASKMAEERIKAHSFELDASKRAKLDAIYKKAEKVLMPK